MEMLDNKAVVVAVAGIERQAAVMWTGCYNLKKKVLVRGEWFLDLKWGWGLRWVPARKR